MPPYTLRDVRDTPYPKSSYVFATLNRVEANFLLAAHNGIKEVLSIDSLIEQSIFHLARICTANRARRIILLQNICRIKAINSSRISSIDL